MLVWAWGGLDSRGPKPELRLAGGAPSRISHAWPRPATMLYWPRSHSRPLPEVVSVAQLGRALDCGSSGRGFESLHSPQLPPWFAVDTPLPGLGRSLRSLSAIASLPGSGCPLRSGRFRAAAIGPAAAYTMPLPAQHDGHPKNGGRGPGVHLGQGCAQTGASLLGFRRREMQRQSLAQLAGAGGFLAGGELSHAEMKMVHRRLWGCLHALLQDR